jgi:hypothetical protein
MARRLWNECDVCGKSDGYTAGNPFVLLRQKRPSDHADMCCVMAGHMECLGIDSVDQLPSIGLECGTATAEQWERWIESPEAQQAGFLWLT